MTDETGTNHANIWEAIIAVMNEVGYVKKQRGANINYTYAGEAALISALRPAMVEHGVFMYVLQVDNLVQDDYMTSRDNHMNRTILRSTIRFQHEGGTYIDVMAAGEGADGGDKSLNKALTGAYKYALRQTFCIETGDDPDRAASEPRAATQAQPAGNSSLRVDIPATSAPSVRTSNITDAAPEQKPAPTNGNGHARPMSPEVLKKAITAKAGKHAGENISAGAKGLMVGQLNAIFGGDENKRHQLTMFLTGYGSTKQMPDNVCQSIMDWIGSDDEMAKREANAVIAFLDGQNGQLKLA